MTFYITKIQLQQLNPFVFIKAQVGMINTYTFYIGLARTNTQKIAGKILKNWPRKKFVESYRTYCCSWKGSEENGLLLYRFRLKSKLPFLNYLIYFVLFSNLKKEKKNSLKRSYFHLFCTVINERIKFSLVLFLFFLSARQF